MKIITSLLVCFITTHVFAQPVIRSFTPASGTVGTTVLIKGTSFNASPDSNIVFFGAVKAVVSNASDSTLTVIVPSGATYQPITITTHSQTAYSTNPFIVTFAGSSGPFTTNSFLPKIDLQAGIYPHSISMADFNGDGKTDIVVSKSSSGVVSVFTNASANGNITFTPQVDLATSGNTHEGSATGDLDGDGKPDFVILNSYTSPSVSIYKNTSVGGTISFASKIDYAADNSPYSVAIGDLDGDGKPDLAVANTGSNKISVYKNTSTPGTISFDARIDFTVGTNPYGIAIGDLDGDGKPDIVITTQGTTSALSVLKNTTTGGTISFGTPINYASMSGAFTVSIGDLDGDGKPDLAAVNSFSNSVTIVRNTSTPGNLSFYGQQDFFTGNYPVCVSISDLDGDGRPDLVTCNRSLNNVSALKNTSTPGNISFDNHVDYAVDTDPFYVVAGDMDGDGRPDIMSANSASTTVSILKNIIGANIAPAISSFSPASGISGDTIKIMGTNFTGATSVKFGGVASSAFTIDSATGITAIVGTGASGDVSITTPNGTATLSGFNFNGPTINSFSPTIGITGTIVTITGSNFTNVTDVKFGGTSASLFTVNSPTTITATVGTGSSGNVTVVTTAKGTASLPGFVFGVPTITSVSPAFGSVGSTIIISGTNFSTTPSGNIVFFGAVKAIVSSATSTRLTVIVPAGATYQPVSVTTNSLTAFSAQPFMVIFPNDSPTLSDSSFSIVGNYGTGAYPSAIGISDLNDDGKPDLIIVNSVGNSISILKNNNTASTFSFNARTDYSTGPDPKRVAIGDLDGDGKPDIVVANFNSGNASTISVFRNTSTNGIISFASKADYVTGNGSIGVAIADMNGDGKPDVIVSSGNSGIFSIFKNITFSSGTISLAPKQDFTSLNHGDNITVADLDMDGKPDLVTSNFSNASISIFRNSSTGGNFSFDAKIDYAAGANPSYITAGDLDSDGKIDLALSNYTSGSISLYKNNSSIGAISFGPKQDYNLGVTSISIADLNGDGKPDLCTGRGQTGIASIIENTFAGTGSFSFASNVNFTTGNYDTFVSVGDLDGDGKPELAVVNSLLNKVTILKNKVSEPAIASLSATSADRGTMVTITGTNFTGTSSVKFGGTPADSFTVVSATKIDAKVGGGASGDVTVTTPLGTAVIQGFKFIPQITADGPTTFCKEGSVTLSSSASANNQWYKDGIAINGAIANTIAVSSSGNYTVQTTANGITTSSPAGITVTAIIVPTPVISIDANNKLMSSVANGNQWYLNGNIIIGATAQTYQPTQSGNYTVSDTLNGCTSDLSTPYNFIITGIISLGNNQYVKLFPNPVKNELNLNWNINGMPLLNIEITDLNGRQLLVRKNISSGTTVDVSQFAQGIYFMKIYSSSLKLNNTIKISKEN